MKTQHTQGKDIKDYLSYNKKTGVFTWIKTSGKAKAGNVAGTNHKSGYIQIVFNYKIFFAHRLAWFFHYGLWPKNGLDHINGDGFDNRIDNLRDVSQRENTSNRDYHRKGKLVGCSFYESKNKWKAQIYENGKQKHIGLFDTELEAHNAYMKRKNERTSK